MTRVARMVLLAVLAVALAVCPVVAGPKAVKFTGNPTRVPIGALSKTLSQVPSYLWYHGCSPTAGGMLMGYWALRGYPRLLPNVTNPMAPGSQNPPSNVYKAISSAEHNARDTYVGHTPNSIADFMKTVNGYTYIENISLGLKNWSTYVGVDKAASSNSYVAYFGGSFNFSKFQSEINAGRPMILTLMTVAPGYDWVGHSVLAYGFQANMFKLTITNGNRERKIIVPGFAVMDTWGNAYGAASAEACWLGWSGQKVYPISQGGYVWWPYLDMTSTRGYSYTNLWDWQVINGVFYNPNPVSANRGFRTIRTFTAGADALMVIPLGAIVVSGGRGVPSAPLPSLLQRVSESSRVNAWSGGEGKGFEAMAALLTF